MSTTGKQFGHFFGDSFDDQKPVRSRASWIEDTGVFVYEKIADAAHMGSSLRTTRSTLLTFILVGAFVTLFVKLVGLQIVSGHTYAAQSEGNRERIIPIPAERGLVYDRNGMQLTKNIPNFSLALTPQDLPRDPATRDDVIVRLATMMETEQEEVRALIERFGNYSYESIILEEDIPYDTALSLLISSADLPGIHIHQGSKRLYIHDPDLPDELQPESSLSHVLGYLAKLNPDELDVLYEKGYLPSDNIGKVGIESSYEDMLRGSYGHRRIEVDVLGKEQAALSEQAPTPGQHVRLSLDLAMQQQLESIIQTSLERSGKARAAAVAVDPRTGAIRALVSLPAYSNNAFSGGISTEEYQTYITNENNPLFNRSIGGTYPSGSSIKPAIAAAALEEGIITQNTSFLSAGGIGVGQWFFPDWLAGGHGMTNVRKSLADSVNTFYYYIGGGYKAFEGMGVERIVQYLRRFGFDEPTGIDIPGEQDGFLPSKRWKEEAKNERWYIGDTYNLSIGQGDLLVTPLQIAMMTSAIANGGTLYSPRLAGATIKPETGAETPITSRIIRERVVDPVHLQSIRLGMRDCVTDGSCARLSLLPFTAAGKTGTAQWSSNKEPHAWFTSFAPYDNPELVLTILVEEGEGGSRMAAPIAQQFYAWWWNYRNN